MPPVRTVASSRPTAAGSALDLRHLAAFGEPRRRRRDGGAGQVSKRWPARPATLAYRRKQPLTLLAFEKSTGRVHVMSVKNPDRSREALREAQEALREAENKLEEVNASLSEERAGASAATLRDLAREFNISEDAVRAFAETAGELLGGEPLSAADARRGAMLAAAGVAWERELGPLLSGALVRELLGGVSRQRVDERLRAKQLIGLRERSGRWSYPLFQFDEGRPIEPLVEAFWIVAEGAVSDWTAASWCVAPDPALDGSSPLKWTRLGGDPERLLQIARQDAARFAQ